jgi:transposase-like protein
MAAVECPLCGSGSSLIGTEFVCFYQRVGGGVFLYKQGYVCGTCHKPFTLLVVDSLASLYPARGVYLLPEDEDEFISDLRYAIKGEG